MPRIRADTAGLLETLRAALRESPQKVFTATGLASFVNRALDPIPSDQRVGTLLRLLREAGDVSEIKLESAAYTPIVRYAVGSPSPFELAQSLRAGAYLSHASAVFLLGLTDQIPKTLYVNKEQTPKPVPTTPLSQAGIDRAFRASPRRTNYVFSYQDYRFAHVSGKNSGNFGAVPVSGPQGEPLLVTNLERTLLDIAVRPIYAGGVYQVLEAYRAGIARLSVPTLLESLRQLDYVYPYHQVLGFYLEKAGLAADATRGFKELGLNWDFYLTHGLREHEYVESWRLFVPRGF